MTLVVSVGDNTVVSEMVPVDSGELGMVAEMVLDATKLDGWCPGWGAKGALLAAATEDDKPEFAVVRVEEGWSKSNRLYTAAFLDNIAEQVNVMEPIGHLGHIPDDEVATSLPDPQTTWFGAMTKTEPSEVRVGEMVKAVYFAGYNLPGAKIRGFLKAKAVRGVSWFGVGEQVPIPGKGVEVRRFVLQSIDWARKGREGMPTSSVVAIAKEMEGEVADKSLAQVTPEEIKKEAPNLVTLLVNDAVAEKDMKIAEMEEEAEKAESDKKLLADARAALKLPDDGDILGTIATLMSKLGDKAKATVTALLDKTLKEKVPDEKKRDLVMRLLPVAEMETKVSDQDEETAEKTISEMVDNAFNTDDTIKGVIGEMTPASVRRREQLGAASTENNEYMVERGGRAV